MDGYEATRQIKSADQEGQIKVIAVSASRLKLEHAAIREGDYDGYIAKPFRESDIFGVLETHLGIRWIYEASSIPEAGEKDRDADDDWQSLMNTVPDPLKNDLKNALIRADMEAVDQLLVQMAEHNLLLAAKLQTYAHDFEYGNHADTDGEGQWNLIITVLTSEKRTQYVVCGLLKLR